MNQSPATTINNCTIEGNAMAKKGTSKSAPKAKKQDGRRGETRAAKPESRSARVKKEISQPTDISVKAKVPTGTLPQWMTPPVAAMFLGVSSGTVREHVRNKVFKTLRVESERKQFIDRLEIVALLKAGVIHARPGSAAIKELALGTAPGKNEYRVKLSDEQETLLNASAQAAQLSKEDFVQKTVEAEFDRIRELFRSRVSVRG